MKLSVVIPAYNSGATICRCISSVIDQDFQDMEIILVDDGSNDGTPYICNEYKVQDSRISVIHKPNSGLSEARNYGIEAAKGDYITFIDSDDSLANGTYTRLFELIDKHPEYDILEYSVNKRYCSGKSKKLKFRDREYRDMKQYWLEEKVYTHAYACNKIYRRSLFDDTKYKTGIIFEDVEILPRLLKKCDVVATTELGTYNYIYNGNGLSANAHVHQLENMLETHAGIMKEVCDDRYFKYIINIQLDVYRMGGKLIIPDGLPYRGMLKLTLYHLLGIKRLCLIHKIFKKITTLH
jgi:glycosyltransferase involved in cell wall biosynthesis